MFKSLKMLYMYIVHNKDKRKVCIRNKKDKNIYYIIRFNKKEGLLSIFFKAMAHIEYAEKKGYIPIIDMKKYSTMYTIKNKNAWNYFFSQPYFKEVDLEDIYTSKNYIVCGFEDDNKIFCNSLFGKYFAFNYEENAMKKEFIDARIVLNHECELMLNDELGKIQVSDMLGVYIRGTDYVNLKPSGHPIQPNFEDIINKIDEFLKLYPEIKGIYLVTEDYELYKKFKNKYCDLINVSFVDNFIKQEKNEYLYKQLKDMDKPEQARKYLVKILILARCKYLISSITNGSVCALAFNGDKYYDKYIFNLGLYD